MQLVLLDDQPGGQIPCLLTNQPIAAGPATVVKRTKPHGPRRSCGGARTALQTEYFV